MLSVGTFVGALSGAPLGDLLGRRMGLVWACVVFNVGAAMQTAATAIPLFTAGRAVAGAGVGIISALIPLYQAETAPSYLRGTLIGSYQLFITIGLLVASCVNKGTQARDNTGSYRIPCAIQIIFGFILMGGMAWLPDTPRYFVKKGQLDKARKSLAQLRRRKPEDSGITTELDWIVSSCAIEMEQAGGWAECFSRRDGHIWRLLTGCSIMALNQLVGVNFIFYFGTQFFQEAGVKSPFIIQLITNLVNVCSCIPGLWLVEKWGRRPLLMFGAAGMFTCQFIVAGVGLGLSTDVANNVLIAFVCFYIFFNAMTWGPVGWTVVGEIFPLQIRAKAVSMSIASIWAFNWAIAYATPYLIEDDSQSANLGYNVFFIWGTCCGIAFLFTYFCVYETKGLSLEQVNELYAVCSFAPRSNAARKRLQQQAAIDADNPTSKVAGLHNEKEGTTLTYVEDTSRD